MDIDIMTIFDHMNKNHHHFFTKNFKKRSKIVNGAN